MLKMTDRAKERQGAAVKGAGLALGPLSARLLREEAAVTTLEYVLAAVLLALAALGAARALTAVLVPYLHRIYLVVALPVP
jgi:Flp pilus assembly pilin Flp